jgi:hypothetical protein
VFLHFFVWAEKSAKDLWRINSSHSLCGCSLTSRQLAQGSGYFFHGKMPGCCLPSLTDFTAGYLKLSLEQEPTPCFAFLGGNSPLPIRSTGAIILP